MVVFLFNILDENTAVSGSGHILGGERIGKIEISH